MAEFIEILIENEKKEQDVVLEFEKESASHYPYYKESYIITPSMNDQILKTAFRILKEDITVKAIPSSGGDFDFENGILVIR